MKNKLLIASFLSSTMLLAQPELSSWVFNKGQYASYWENTSKNSIPTYTFYTSTVLSDVTKVCYSNDYVWTESDGMTTNMGQFLNPGAPTAQNYIYRFPRKPTVPTTKTTSPYVGSIGLLINGVPIYGLSNAGYWNGTNNNGKGTGTWNVEVYKSEGLVLDATLGAHPQQQGAYHSHAKPARLYTGTGTNVHSPIVGYAFDGYPVYGPYGYANATVVGTVSRMKSGYSLRNITTRTTLSDGTALASDKYGPAVSTTYPIGTYIEDYEWLASNGGDLDKYNGRFCRTPEYPNGTYAYFVTVDASGTPQFPYYIGPQYYGAPETDDITFGKTITIPTSGVTCITTFVGNTTTPGTTSLFGSEYKSVTVFPNPAVNKTFNLNLPDLSGVSQIEIYSTEGLKVFEKTVIANLTEISFPSATNQSVYILKVINNNKVYSTKIQF